MEAPVEVPFIGRHRELDALQEAYEAPISAFWAIYGRRRVGKSELIRHFAIAERLEKDLTGSSAEEGALLAQNLTLHETDVGPAENQKFR